MGAITDWMRGGEQADLIISSLQSISSLVCEGKIEPTSQKSISRSEWELFVASGAPVPSIGTVEDLSRALLSAKTIVYADPSRGGAAGIHIARVIQDLGMADQLKPKIRFGAGGDVTEATLAQGEGAIGMTQVSEIVGKPGAVFFGPFPEKIQNYTMFAMGGPIRVEAIGSGNGVLGFSKDPSCCRHDAGKGHADELIFYKTCGGMLDSLRRSNRPSPGPLRPK